MFRDREEAAHQLAAHLRGRALRDPLVLAIPRGGVVTGAVLARELSAELDVVLARKLRAPEQLELALGAVAEDGTEYLNALGRDAAALAENYLDQERRYQAGELARRRALFRAVRPQAPVAGRSVIVTDDGLATGATMIAALHALRPRAPYELIAAVPVAAMDRLAEVAKHCDAVVCPLTPVWLTAVGHFYQDFRPVEDAQVVDLLRKAAPALAGA